MDSIISQSYQNWECIVVDDDSTDYTQELMDFYVNRDNRIKYFKRPGNKIKGANSCRNYGFELSNGDFINWFDDDDLMHPEKLERQIQTLKYYSYNYSICQTLVFDNKINNILGLRNPYIISDNTFNDYLRMQIGWMTPAVLWRKEFLVQYKFKFDVELQAAQEWEFHCRILNKFPLYTIIEDPLVWIRKHDQSITYNQNEKIRYWYYFQARLKVYRNKDLVLDPVSNQFLRKYLLNSFKEMIITKNPHVFDAYKLYILPEKGIKTKAKLNAFLAIWSFRLFNKGNFPLQKIKYT